MKEYYTDEIKRALDGHDNQFSIGIVLSGTTGQTKTLNLNAESIPVIIEYLKSIKL